MGQYWKPVNLDKKECLDPHTLGCGLKLWEQLANAPSTGSALVILTAAMPEPRGGGDFDLDEVDETGHDAHTGPMPAAYPALARWTIGRWAGDRIALVGDYADDADLAPEHQASRIYEQCSHGGYRDISEAVCRVLERELCGRFRGTGWRHFVKNGTTCDCSACTQEASAS